MVRERVISFQVFYRFWRVMLTRSYSIRVERYLCSFNTGRTTTVASCNLLFNQV